MVLGCIFMTSTWLQGAPAVNAHEQMYIIVCESLRRLLKSIEPWIE